MNEEEGELFIKGLSNVMKEKREQNKKECIAKVKFWFGKEEPIFNTEKYTVEIKDNYAYIYER